jgi:hypothetical protein
VKQSGDDGFTLLETVMAVAISLIVITGFFAAYLVSIRVTGSATNHFSASHDAQISSTYFNNDVQSATAVTGAANCAASGSLASSQNLINFTLPGTTEYSSYYYGTVGSEHQIRRAYCKSGSLNEVTIAHFTSTTTAPAVTCAPTAQCPAPGGAATGLPASVLIRVTEQLESLSDSTSAFAWTLSASRRPTVGTAPNIGVLALGASTGSLQVSGGTLNAVGPIYVNASVSGSVNMAGLGLRANGGIQIVAPGTCTGCTASNTTPVPPMSTRLAVVTDPYSQISPPDELGNCNPATPAIPCLTFSGTTFSSGPGIYTSLVTTTGSVTMTPGIYILRAGVNVASGSLQGSGILLYLGCGINAPSGCSGTGNVTVVSPASVALSALTSGSFAGLSIFISADNGSSSNVTISTGTTSSIGGVIYAPSGSITLASASTLAVQSVISSTFVVTGGTVNVGP